MNRKLVFVSFIIFTSIFLIVYSISTTAAPPPPEPGENEIEKQRIKQALTQAIDSQREYVIAYLINDVQITSVDLSDDETSGVIYLELVDPETGEVLPTEPGLAFAVKSGSEWQIILPSDPGWLELVQSAPEELLSAEYKLSYVEMYETELQTAGATYAGYLLPWEAGRTVYLSQSTGHDRYIPSGSAHYSFDFYIHKTMYDIRAAKSGTVWRARWDVANGNDDDMGNYIVLKDDSTTPTTYQLYLHLAKGSIPAELRSTGAYVAQGQFIGVADDTGQSTGHHLHFHVHTNPNSYWGTSVDITFADVDINGGRPRRESDLPYCNKPGDVCNKFRTNYISANVAPGDNQPPIGDLFEPETGVTVQSSAVVFDGWAYDEDSGVNATRLMAYFNNEWHEVGEELPGNNFTGSWEWCSDDVPDGPVSLAVKIRDNAGNYSTGLHGLTHVAKDYECSTSLIKCNPGPDQIAVYSSTDFQGICQTFDIGEFTQISPQMDLNIDSIQIGSNVYTQVFGDVNFSGRTGTVKHNDSNLDDNPVRRNQIRSLKVLPKNINSGSAFSLVYPQPGKQFNTKESLSFSWRSSGPGNEFQVNIVGPPGQINSVWLPASYWIADNLQLTEGVYTWKVRSRSCSDPGCVSPWSGTSTFEIAGAQPVMLSTSAPFTDSLESGTANWSSTGLWNLLNDSGRSHSQDNAWYYGNSSSYHYATNTPNSGTLTSKPILIPEENYQLRFWYRYDTEEPGANWDQRWVQISANGSPFMNVAQLADDVENHWLQKRLDLTPYIGQEIQIRFLFTTLDKIDNDNGEGWLIDDIEIVQESKPSCNDGNESFQTAESINYGQTITRLICPTGDVDFYRFEGLAGDHIVVDIDTTSENPVPNLDLFLFLVDGDGLSELAYHDDEILGTIFDPHLGYQLKRSGTYYLRTRLWSHPSHGGDDFEYQITLSKDNQPPSGSIIKPISNSYINNQNTFQVSVNAVDSESGISHVEFMYHSADWLASDWQDIGIDQDGTNGWGITLDAADYSEQDGTAFFARIFDWAGNWVGSGAWEVGFDRSPPTTSLQILQPVQLSTAVQLNWSGTDNLSGIHSYDLESQLQGGQWSAILPPPGSTKNSAWFVGKPGSDYGFRMRATDNAGNLEAFPQSPETATSIPGPGIICSQPDPWDSSGDDNTSAKASQVVVNASPSMHNFCNPLTTDRLFDEDWVKFSPEPGQAYLIETSPLATMTGSIIELYAPDGMTLLTSAQSEAFNQIARIIWTASEPGDYYLRVRHIDGRVAGNFVSYNLRIIEFIPTFLPIIYK